ncbi:MAG: DUF4189 domain-containing protein [Roseovarius sp.]
MTLSQLFAACLSCAVLITALPASADPLPEPWQSQRETANALSDKACAGDPAAVAQTRQLIAEGDVIMLNNTAWLKDNCNDFKSYTEDELAAFQLRSALGGYPLALSGYGSRLIRGDAVPKDAKTGVAMMDQAANAGYGFAAYYLAEYYTNGKYFSADPAKARAYLAIAKRENIVADAIDDLSRKIDAAEAKLAPMTGAKQFAALAVSLTDGGFGFAHDYPSASEARARATQECQSRGGQSCDIKLVGQGKGCMAYHSAGGSATAHGWAIGATQDAVTTRAATECRTRNGDASCGTTSWVCNDRTQVAFDVVFEAPNPPLAAAMTDLSGCLLTLQLECYTDNAKEETEFVAGPFQLNYAGCQNDNLRSLTYKYKKNDYEKWGDDLSPEGLMIAAEYINRMKKNAQELSSQCRPNKIWASMRNTISAEYVARLQPGTSSVLDGFSKDKKNWYAIELAN